MSQTWRAHVFGVVWALSQFGFAESWSLYAECVLSSSYTSLILLKFASLNKRRKKLAVGGDFVLVA